MLAFRVSIHLNVFPPIDIALYKIKLVSLSDTVEKGYRFYVGLTAEIVAVLVEGPNLATQKILHVCVSLSNVYIRLCF